MATHCHFFYHSLKNFLHDSSLSMLIQPPLNAVSRPLVGQATANLNSKQQRSRKTKDDTAARPDDCHLYLTCYHYGETVSPLTSWEHKNSEIYSFSVLLMVFSICSSVFERVNSSNTCGKMNGNLGLSTPIIICHVCLCHRKQSSQCPLLFMSSCQSSPASLPSPPL